MLSIVFMLTHAGILGIVNNYALRVILSDVRSAGNVGAILRTSDACSVELVYAAGYTPHPHHHGDVRPPHVASSNTRAISKTALGAELTVATKSVPDTASAIQEARDDGFKIIVIEQSEKALNLYHYRPTGPIAIVMGNEVDGVSGEILSLADTVLELPMLGAKESLNVAVAAGIVLYQLRFGN